MIPSEARAFSSPRSGRTGCDLGRQRDERLLHAVRACGARGTTSGAPVSGTLFHVDWTDIQVAGLTPFRAEPITLNGGGAVSVAKGRNAGRRPARRRHCCVPLVRGSHCHCSGSIVVPPACSSVVRIRADSGRRGGYADGGTARVGRQRRGVARTRRTWCRFPRRGPSDRWCCAISSVARAWIFVQGHRLVFYICTSFP